MDRRDLVGLLGAALGLTAATPALAGPVLGPPVAGLDPRHPADLEGHLHGVHAHLDALTATPAPPLVAEYLSVVGLPADLLARTLRALAATAAFRELTPAAQAHPAAQDLLRAEAPGAALATGAWSAFLKRERHAQHAGAALQAHPTLAVDIRAKIQDALRALDVPERWADHADHHLERVLWRSRHQSAVEEARTAVAEGDRRLRLDGVDPDQMRASADLGPAGAAAELPKEDQQNSTERTGLAAMGVGAAMGLVGILGALYLSSPFSVTVLVLIGIPGICFFLVGLITWALGASHEDEGG